MESKEISTAEIIRNLKLLCRIVPQDAPLIQSAASLIQIAVDRLKELQRITEAHEVMCNTAISLANALEVETKRAERAEEVIKAINRASFPITIHIGQSEGREILFCSSSLSIIQSIISKWRKGDSNGQ